MDVSSIESDVCKTVTSLGFSKDRTHAILNGLHRTLMNNGPEWMVGRLNSLRDYYVDPGNSVFPAWIAKTRRSDGALRPTGWLGQVVGAHTDTRSVVTLLSTVSKAVTLDAPSDKQLTKWNGAVTNPPEPDRSQAIGSMDQSPYPLRGFEAALVREWTNRPFFGPDSIGGSRIPFGDMTMSIKHDDKGMPHLGDLHRAWELSITYAPAMAWSFQDQTGFGISGLSIHQSKVSVNAMRKRAPDSGKRLKVNPKTMRLQKRSGRVDPIPRDYPIGSISFLQQASAKLRAVANPNRFVQWQNEPLQKVLSSWVNSQPGVFTLNQDEGIRWIQSRLGMGVHLTSADLSSASDTLDYQQITRLLKDPKCPLLKTSVEYFERCSSAPWSVSDHRVRESLDLQTVRWKQGQPLGLAPSFAILTMTNLSAAQQAVIDVEGSVPAQPPYAIVGDDIVIESKYAERYAHHISSLGGVTNIEKSMSSDVRAEFCSRIIEPDLVYRLKPRYISDNEPQNLLTYQGTKVKIPVKGWIRRMAKRVGAMHLAESGAIPNFNSDKPAPLSEKDLVHAVLSLSKGETPDLMEVSLMTTHMHDRSTRDPEHQGRRGDPSRSGPLGFRKIGPETRWQLLVDRNPGKVPTDEELVHACPSILGSAEGDRLHDLATRMLAYDARYRSQFPGLSYPTLSDQSDDAMQILLADVAREQRISPRTKYDYQSDSRTRIVNHVTAVSLLDRKIKAIKAGMVRDSEGLHFLSETEEGLLTVLEDARDSYRLSFQKGRQESTPSFVSRQRLGPSPNSRSRDDGIEPGM